MNPSGEVTIAANLVRYQRKGVKRELTAVVEILAARELLDAVGVLDESATQVDLTLDLGRWPHLILKTLESEYVAELTRLQDAEAEGVEPPLRDLPDLAGLVADIRRKMGGPPRDPEHRLRRQPATKRSRGHGCHE